MTSVTGNDFNSLPPGSWQFGALKTVRLVSPILSNTGHTGQIHAILVKYLPQSSIWAVLLQYTIRPVGPILVKYRLCQNTRSAIGCAARQADDTGFVLAKYQVSCCSNARFHAGQMPASVVVRCQVSYRSNASIHTSQILFRYQFHTGQILVRLQVSYWSNTGHPGLTSG